MAGEFQNSRPKRVFLHNKPTSPPPAMQVKALRAGKWPEIEGYLWLYLAKNFKQILPFAICQYYLPLPIHDPPAMQVKALQAGSRVTTLPCVIRANSY